MHRLVLLLTLLAAPLLADDRPPFRTDADGPFDARQLPKKGKPQDGGPAWFPLVDGEFPPDGSGHLISGELIQVDHLERQFYLRVDRGDYQDRGVFDLPLDAVMLPYGSIWYHGAPAALQDIPLGTHLRGLFYLRDPDDKTPPPPANNNRRTPEHDFRRCFRLEDDFSFHARQKQAWRVESVDLATKKLTATLVTDGKPAEKPLTFDLLAGTRVWRGEGLGTLDSIEPGQIVQFDLTWATLYGPGRITDLWLDETSRERATARQLEVHRQHVRERGLPGWVEAVDDETQVVTVTFFGGVDPALFDELSGINPEPFGWPLSKPEDNPKAPKATIAVARESLMTFDPVNDRKGGNILAIKKIPAPPGCGGVQVSVKCDMLLEGYRPKRIVRVYPATWKVIELPREERYEGRE